MIIHQSLRNRSFLIVAISLTLLVLVASESNAQPPISEEPIADIPASEPEDDAEFNEPMRPEDSRSPTVKSVVAAFSEPKGATRLAPDARLWIDKKRRRVIVDGYVAFREGPLEMFACPAGTKEHESAVALLARSRYVHAALLAIGATPGHPARFDPEFAPPTGDRIAIWVLWRDEDGTQKRMKAQQWVKKMGTKEPLDVEWVFGGSLWWTDPQTGHDFYTADDGDLICVSNFSSATLDIPIESSKANAVREFSAFTENMPPRRTPVRVVMIPISPALNAKPSEDKGPDKPEPKADPS